MLEFFGQVWQALIAALTFDQAVLAPLMANPLSGVMFTIALLAGISQLLGDSVVLFVNRVKPARVAVTLLGTEFCLRGSSHCGR